MMEERGNNEYYYNNENEIDASLLTMRKIKVSCPDIKFKFMIMECGDIKYNNSDDNEIYSIMYTTNKGEYKMFRYHIPNYKGGM